MTLKSTNVIRITQGQPRPTHEKLGFEKQKKKCHENAFLTLFRADFSLVGFAHRGIRRFQYYIAICFRTLRQSWYIPNTLIGTSLTEASMTLALRTVTGPEYIASCRQHPLGTLIPCQPYHMILQNRGFPRNGHSINGSNTEANTVPIQITCTLHVILGFRPECRMDAGRPC